MDATILTVGLLCLVTAIVGGGVTLLGNQLPVLKSAWQQVLLGVFGVLMIGFALRSELNILPAPTDKGAQVSTPAQSTSPSTAPATGSDDAANLNSAQRAADILTPDGSAFRNETQEAQYRMIALGFDVGYPDGFEGPKTTEALAVFQRQFNLPVSGTADVATLEILRARSRKAFLRLQSESGNGATDYQKHWLPGLTE